MEKIENEIESYKYMLIGEAMPFFNATMPFVQSMMEKMGPAMEMLFDALARATSVQKINCKKFQKSLAIEFIADKRSRKDNKIILEKKKNHGKRNWKKMLKFTPSKTFNYETCL